MTLVLLSGCGYAWSIFCPGLTLGSFCSAVSAVRCAPSHSIYVSLSPPVCGVLHISLGEHDGAVPTSEASLREHDPRTWRFHINYLGWERGWDCLEIHVPKSCEKGPCINYLPTPPFCFNFLRRSKVYSKKRLSNWSHVESFKCKVSLALFPGSPHVQKYCKRWKAGRGLGTRLRLVYSYTENDVI